MISLWKLRHQMTGALHQEADSDTHQVVLNLDTHESTTRPSYTQTPCATSEDLNPRRSSRHAWKLPKPWPLAQKYTNQPHFYLDWDTLHHLHYFWALKIHPYCIRIARTWRFGSEILPTCTCPFTPTFLRNRSAFQTDGDKWGLSYWKWRLL